MGEKPVKTIRHRNNDGSRSVEAAIWKNESEAGRTFFNVTFKCQYKVGKEYNTTTSYGASDLFNLLRCITDASAFLFFENLRMEKGEPVKRAGFFDDVE